MKLRGIIGLALAFACSPTLAQTNPGTSPLSGAKGGTNNSFMQFAGPATSMKTFTLPNASGTVGVLNAIATWTAVQSFSDGTLVLLGSSSGSSTLKAPATGGGTATLFAGSDTVAGRATTDIFTNKTLTSSTNVLGGVTMTLGSDATGDIYYRSGGVLTRLPIGTNTNVLTVVSGLPSWQAGTAAASVTMAVTTVNSCATTGGILYNNSGTFQCAAVFPAFLTAGAGISITGTTNATIAKIVPTTTVGQPANPTSTSSVSGVMMGLGSTCAITPSYSTKVRVTFDGIVGNNTSGQTASINLRFSTGAAPANGAASAGSVITNTSVYGNGSSPSNVPFSKTSIATSLTAGTAYWFDLLLAVSANTGSMSGITCTIEEL